MTSIVAYAQFLAENERMTPAVSEALAKAREIRSRHEYVCYVAGALTGMPDVVKDRYVLTSQLFDSLSGPGRRLFGYAPHLHGTDPVVHPTVTPAEVRDIDHLFAVVIPDFHLNFTDPVAHGNGIEEGWAETAGIPTVYVSPASQRLSRIVLGMHNVTRVIRYNDFASDGLVKVEQLLHAFPKVETMLHALQDPRSLA